MRGDYTRELWRIEAWLRVEDPRFARGLETGKPCPPREYRLRWSLLLLVAVFPVLVTGLVLGSLPLVVGALALAGTAVALYRRTSRIF